MTQRDTGPIRARLEAMRAELLADQENLPIGEDEEVSDSGPGQHYADDATNVFLRERNLALRNNADDIAAQIDGALARIDNGSYGTCERCGRPIGDDRLEALPYAALCIECARAEGPAARA
jgi:DnaK suppressor protein